ncbi:carboxymuconolactone decarboxylase family protein [Streptomyces polygonati]|uniref:Carboxymuconolactone decarboxylase family protein n=1 Tax=Streptomyces polygonati TaxID=1617087 RepID=A0ABV8HNJ3_9ACTN
MRARLVRTSLRELSLVQIRHVAPVPFRTSQPVVSRVYREVEREFGVLAPPLALHAPSPEVTAAVWIILRESLVSPGLVGRQEKEAVAAMISRANTCPYCVTMHTSMWASLGGEAESSGVSAWARANAVRESDDDGDPVPFPADHAPELVAVAVLLQYLNRMVNIFLGDAPLPPKVPTQALRVVAPTLNWLQHAADRDSVRPGSSLELLPPAPLPEDLRWTGRNTVLADAFSRAAAAIDAAGARALPEPVRDLVLDSLKGWDGRPAGIGRGWVETAVARLGPADRAAGRLALLTALASYQIDDGVVEGFRADTPEDGPLIEATAWAAMAAAREAGAWMRTKQ